MRVRKGRALVPSDANGLADPFVRLRLGSQEARTHVIQNCLDPLWDFVAVFPVDDIATDTLVLECFDRDVILADDRMGEARVRLSTLPLDERDTRWLKLEQVPQGEILIDCLLRLPSINDQSENPPRSALSP